MYSTLHKPRVPLRQAQDAALAPPPAAALRCEIARLREENARLLRSVALWKEIALSEHGQAAARLVHSEHKCNMLRFLLFSAWVKLGKREESNQSTQKGN